MLRCASQNLGRIRKVRDHLAPNMHSAARMELRVHIDNTQLEFSMMARCDCGGRRGKVV